MVRNNIIEYYFVNPHTDMKCSYAARMPPPVSAPDLPSQSLAWVVRPCNTPGKLTVRNNILEYYFVNPHTDTICSYAARMPPPVSVSDPSSKSLEGVVRPFHTSGKLIVKSNIIQYYFINANSDIKSSYVARMMSSGSAPDPPLPFLEHVVSPCNALFSGRGVPIVDRIYPVIPDPRRKPDAEQL